MKGSLFTSALLHGGMLAVAIIGLPHEKRIIPESSIYIPVEVMDIDEFTSLITPPTPETIEQPPEATPETPPTPPESPQPPPAIEPITAPELPEEIAAPREPELVAVPDLTPPTPAAEPQIEEPPPPPTEAELIAALDRTSMLPPRTRRPRPEPEPEPEPEPVNDVNSILDNLVAEAPQEEPVLPQIQSQNSLLNNDLTVSELDAFRSQFRNRSCWNYNGGGANIDEYVARIYVEVNRNREVIRTEILNSNSEINDTSYGALIESADRAIKKCSPLILPEGKYDEWNELILNFSPEGII